MISYKDGGKLRAMLPFCPQGIEIILGW